MHSWDFVMFQACVWCFEADSHASETRLELYIAENDLECLTSCLYSLRNSIVDYRLHHHAQFLRC